MSISRTPDVTNIKDFSYGAATLFNAVTTTGTSSVVTIEGNASAFVSVDTGGNYNTIFKLEGTADGTKWWTIRGLDYESGSIDGQFQGDRSIHYNISGLYQIRGNITAIAGTATVKMRYQASEVSIGPREISVNNFPATPTEISIRGTGFPANLFEPNTDGSIAIGDGTDTLAINTDGSIAIGDGTDVLAINTDGSINITDNDGSITVDGTVNVNINQMDSFTHSFFTNTNANILGTTYFIGSSYNYMGIQIVATGFTGTANFLYKTVTGAWQTLPVYQPGVNTAYTTYVFTGNTGTFAFYTYLPANTYVNTQITGYAGTGTASAIADFSVRPYELFQNTAISANRVNLTTSTGANLYLSQTTPTVDNASTVTATNTNAQLLISNGTNWDRLRGDTRGLFVSDSKFVETALVTMQNAAVALGNGTAYANLDLNYTSGLFKITGTFVGTITFESSTDNSTWNALTVYNMATSSSTTTATTTGNLYTPLTLGTYYRARISAYTSGSITVSFATNNRPAVTPNLDGVLYSALSASAPYAFNGTNYERIRTVAGVADGGATGLAAEGSYGWNGTGWDRVRANNVHKYQEYLSLTNGQHLEIWTPAAGKKFRLMNVLFSSNYATGARVTLRDSVGGTTAGAANLATFNFNAKDTSSFEFGPNGYLSFAANNRLAVFNDSGSTVSVWLTFIGTEE